MNFAAAVKKYTLYQLCDHKNRMIQCCLVELEDNSMVKLDCDSMEKVIKSGMQNSGLSNGKKVVGITWIQAYDKNFPIVIWVFVRYNVI